MIRRKCGNLDVGDLDAISLIHFVNLDTRPALQVTTAALGSDDGRCVWELAQGGQIGVIIMEVREQDNVRRPLQQEIGCRVLPVALQKEHTIAQDGVGQHSKLTDVYQYGCVADVTDGCQRNSLSMDALWWLVWVQFVLALT